jgi:hypothetical protein
VQNKQNRAGFFGAVIALFTKIFMLLLACYAIILLVKGADNAARKRSHYE